MFPNQTLSDANSRMVLTSLLALVLATVADIAVAQTPTPVQIFRDCPSCPEMVVVPTGSSIIESAWGERGRSRTGVAVTVKHVPTATAADA